MDERILLEAVVRAGELMLVSGAEVYRVEDTMKHMLARSGFIGRPGQGTADVGEADFPEKLQY